MCPPVLLQPTDTRMSLSLPGTWRAHAAADLLCARYLLRRRELAPHGGSLGIRLIPGHICLPILPLTPSSHAIFHVIQPHATLIGSWSIPASHEKTLQKPTSALVQLRGNFSVHTTSARLGAASTDPAQLCWESTALHFVFQMTAL